MVVNLVLEFEYVGSINIKFVNGFGIGGECSEVFCNVFFIICCFQELVMCVMGVGYGFLSGEGFRCYQEQCGFWVYFFQYFSDVSFIDVRNKVYVQVVFVWMQCFGYYVWVEVRIVDFDVYYVSDCFVGIIFLFIGNNCF